MNSCCHLSERKGLGSIETETFFVSFFFTITLLTKSIQNSTISNTESNEIPMKSPNCPPYLFLNLKTNLIGSLYK